MASKPQAASKRFSAPEVSQFDREFLTASLFKREPSAMEMRFWRRSLGLRMTVSDESSSYNAWSYAVGGCEHHLRLPHRDYLFPCVSPTETTCPLASPPQRLLAHALYMRRHLAGECLDLELAFSRGFRKL